ncbi:membrane protein DedA, SNARE-associated domain [Amycolatopsis arida]|uniref:Membrane protein DedA, SNARE-associated domain n=1 Tax=Amycolatopsis arida TaxID=587909 RepID=A0A1I5S8S4_9PSEU|nr:membrane protein DedA with SNARE-associated domain [Amycolatopsis arida]SFP67113.1 membrane protein DedA, SNARE-associated domain [Amycolatopsis arida]
MVVEHWLAGVPPLSAYAVVAGVVGLESLGIPLPGELVLVSAALLAARYHGLSPVWVAAGAGTGAIVGDSLGYAIGRTGGRRVLDRLARRFPGHLGAHRLRRTERLVATRGALAVFGGRFVALLRMLAGPLAGALRMPYPTFLAANVLGGLVWAAGTTALVYYLGVVVEAWLSRLSWFALAAVAGVAVAVLVARRTRRNRREPPGDA